MGRTEDTIHKLRLLFSCHTELDPIDCKKQLRVCPRSQGYWVDVQLGRIPISWKESINTETQPTGHSFDLRRFQLLF